MGRFLTEDAGWFRAATHIKHHYYVYDSKRMMQRTLCKKYRYDFPAYYISDTRAPHGIDECKMCNERWQQAYGNVAMSNQP